MKKIKKTLAAILCLTMLFSCFAMNTFAATSARVGSGSYCRVDLTNNKAAKVTLRVRDMWPSWNNTATVHIKLTDGNGKWLKEWDARGNTTFNLGTDHRSYRIYVSNYYKQPSNYWNDCWNFENTGKAYKWAFENPKNCSIS